MGLSIKILGCNGQCKSCYENSIRNSKDYRNLYDINAVIETLKTEMDKDTENSRNVPTLHGGEPLILGTKNVEQLLKVIYDKYQRTSIQTNGLLIDERYIELFTKYKTSVGISLDGDTSELNRGRWNLYNLSNQEIQEYTNLVLENISKCKKAGLSVSVITVLRKYNAAPSKLPELIRFLRRLHSEFGIAWVRTNEGIVFDEKQRKEEELTSSELGLAFVSLASICFSNPNLKWSPYRDVVDVLLGNKNVVCVLTECDVWHTTAEEPIDGFGGIGNCLKGGGARDGYQVLRTKEIGSERYEALKQIPMALGGCKGCRYWKVCKGGCPGAGKDNDWRNKTRFCSAWYSLFTYVERTLKGLIPGLYLASEGSESFKETFSGIINRNSYSDYSKLKKKVDEYIDRHGDSPHGDHTDYSGRIR